MGRPRDWKDVAVFVAILPAVAVVFAYFAVLETGIWIHRRMKRDPED